MKEEQATPIRAQILRINLIVIAVTVALALGGSLALALRERQQVTDQNLMNSAQVIARVPMVARDLSTGVPTEELWAFLDGSIAQVSDIDVIAVADLHSIQLYYPDRQLIGQLYSGTVQQRILQGEGAFTSDDSGVSGAEHCAYAPVHGVEGELLGFVMVGIYMRSMAQSLWHILTSFALIALAVAILGGLLSAKLSDRIKRSLMGYEPAAFLSLFQQREDILEALEEGILAIDTKANIIYLNRAAAGMLGLEHEGAAGKPLHRVYPRSTLDRVLRSKRPEYNVPLRPRGDMRILADRMPIRGDGRVIGAVAIFRNRTEVTRLADDLTGVEHMVEAMRAYTHEFMNKLHVILGLLQLGEAEKAQAYIMDVSNLQQKAVGAIARSIKAPSVAALLVGKTSRCAELGIRLVLDPESHLSAEENFLPSAAYITILGNLIENAIDALNQSGRGQKEITVSLQEREEEGLFICVEDTGPGMAPRLTEHIFQSGFTTKGGTHGTGLALVAEVVSAYQGDIRVESEPGVGTAFFIHFSPEGGKGA